MTTSRSALEIRLPRASSGAMNCAKQEFNVRAVRRGVLSVHPSWMIGKGALESLEGYRISLPSERHPAAANHSQPLQLNHPSRPPRTDSTSLPGTSIGGIAASKHTPCAQVAGAPALCSVRTTLVRVVHRTLAPQSPPAVTSTLHVSSSLRKPDRESSETLRQRSADLHLEREMPAMPGVKEPLCCRATDDELSAATSRSPNESIELRPRVRPRSVTEELLSNSARLRLALRLVERLFSSGKPDSEGSDGIICAGAGAVAAAGANAAAGAVAATL
mmetsp:Transcript_10169/g.20697  ORF Transcript_10169/g.20697 Transcript_10169/m.20697 type:complete len:275 (+) Transcript_10169:189-1013(+)